LKAIIIIATIAIDDIIAVVVVGVYVHLKTMLLLLLLLTNRC
jgi:hypothetical protein